MTRSRLARCVLLGCLVLAAAASAPASTSGAIETHCFHESGLIGKTYTTHCFVRGLRVTVPHGWQNGEDSSIELKLLPPHDTNPDTPALRFWIDPHASTPCSDHLLPVDTSTPAKVIRWLRSNKNLLVSKPRPATIGHGIAALRVDLDLRRHAPRCSPDCPGPCVDYFSFRAPGEADSYGTGRGELVRLYFAHVSSPSHLFMFGIDAPNAKKFKQLTSLATRMLASVRLPARLPPRTGR